MLFLKPYSSQKTRCSGQMCIRHEHFTEGVQSRLVAGGNKKEAEAIAVERKEASVQDTGNSQERREGTSADTVATPDDFPEEYDYGSGRASDWSREDMLRKMPMPKGNDTVLDTVPDPSKIQAFYLWEEGNVSAVTPFTEDMDEYFDQWDFRPFVTAIPVRSGVKPKGAVVLMAGGAYQFRGNYTDSLPTAAALREYGFQTFIVDYRLHPYTQEEKGRWMLPGRFALSVKMRMPMELGRMNWIRFRHMLRQPE